MEGPGRLGTDGVACGGDSTDGAAGGGSEGTAGGPEEGTAGGGSGDEAIAGGGGEEAMGGGGLSNGGEGLLAGDFGIVVLVVLVLVLLVEGGAMPVGTGGEASAALSFGSGAEVGGSADPATVDDIKIQNSISNDQNQTLWVQRERKRENGKV